MIFIIKYLHIGDGLLDLVLLGKWTNINKLTMTRVWQACAIVKYFPIFFLPLLTHIAEEHVNISVWLSSISKTSLSSICQISSSISTIHNLWWDLHNWSWMQSISNMSRLSATRETMFVSLSLVTLVLNALQNFYRLRDINFSMIPTNWLRLARIAWEREMNDKSAS